MKVSILIPVRDPDPGIFKECLESINNQTCTDIEVVIVDNGGWSDDIQSIIDSTITNYNPKVIIENNPGIRFALNTGLKACDGELIARMDADDVMTPDRISRQVEFMEINTDTDVTAGNVELLETIQRSDGMLQYVKEVNELKSHDDIYHYRFIDSPVIHPSIMFRRSVLKFGDYPETEGEPEDYAMIMRWINNGVKFGKVDEKILYWRDSPTRLTRVHEDYSRDSFHKVRMRYLPEAILNSIKGRDTWVWGAGKHGRRMIKEVERSGVNIAGTIDIVHDKKVDGRSSIHFKEIPPDGEVFILSVVSNRGKHLEIRDHLNSAGYSEGLDYIRCIP